MFVVHIWNAYGTNWCELCNTCYRYILTGYEGSRLSLWSLKMDTLHQAISKFKLFRTIQLRLLLSLPVSLLLDGSYTAWPWIQYSIMNPSWSFNFYLQNSLNILIQITVFLNTYPPEFKTKKLLYMYLKCYFLVTQVILYFCVFIFWKCPILSQISQ